MAKKTETKQEKPKVEDAHESDKVEEKAKPKVASSNDPKGLKSAEPKGLEREYVIPLRARCKKVPKYL